MLSNITAVSWVDPAGQRQFSLSSILFIINQITSRPKQNNNICRKYIRRYMQLLKWSFWVFFLFSCVCSPSSCFASTAWVLPGVPHQEGLRRDRAEHLPPQPCVRSHVLTLGGGGVRRCKDRLRRCFWWLILLWMCGMRNQNIKRKTKKRETRPNTDRLEMYCECSYFLSFRFFWDLLSNMQWVIMITFMMTIKTALVEDLHVDTNIVISWQQNILFMFIKHESRPDPMTLEIIDKFRTYYCLLLLSAHVCVPRQELVYISYKSFLYVKLGKSGVKNE